MRKQVKIMIKSLLIPQIELWLMWCALILHKNASYI